MADMLKSKSQKSRKMTLQKERHLPISTTKIVKKTGNIKKILSEVHKSRKRQNRKRVND